MSLGTRERWPVQVKMAGFDVRAEQVRTIYRHTAPVLITNCVNAAIVSAVLWGSGSRPLLVSWVALIGAMSVARASLYRRYRRAAPPPAEAGRWGAWFVVGSAAAGLLWGASAFLLRERAGTLAELLVTFVIGGMCAAAAGTLASYLPAFLAFVMPALTALALRMLSFGGSIHIAMAVLVVIYAAGLFAVAKVNSRVLSDAFSLRFENAELLRKLRVTQVELEETNRSLEERVALRSDALRKQAEALRDAQRMESIGRLAGGVAHDFNNLLTIILANVGELLKRPALDGPARTSLGEMRDAASKGADLVRQLLMFGRRQRTTPETLDLNRVVSAMDRLLGRLLGEPLTLRVVLHDNPVFVHVDSTQIEQVIINLVTNARDAMTSGGVVTIETEIVELFAAADGVGPGTYALLSVRDTGSGMDLATRQRIFEPFFTTKEIGKGTGLGLATVYGIVEQSGGQIQVSTELHQGSCFRVYLSLAQPPVSERSEAQSLLGAASGVRESPKQSRGVTVLLVEDEPTVRSVTRRILESVGHRVLCAQSAEQALKLSGAHAGPIELLVSDVVMAGIGGPALATRLSEQRPELITLFISGYTHNQVLANDQAGGGVGFLAKPFTYDSLIAKVAELLGDRSREQQPVAKA